MSSYISNKTRSLVAKRAENRCEYCLIPSLGQFKKHEIEHIFSFKHSGTSAVENLALACWNCNRYKGSDVGSFDIETKKFVPFFNPRTEIWSEHFAFENGLIVPLTAEARVTVKILRLNDETRIEERRELFKVGGYRVLR